MVYGQALQAQGGQLTGVPGDVLEVTAPVFVTSGVFLSAPFYRTCCLSTTEVAFEGVATYSCDEGITCCGLLGGNTTFSVTCPNAVSFPSVTLKANFFICTFSSHPAVACSVSASLEEYKKFQWSGSWPQEKVFVFSAMLGPMDTRSCVSLRRLSRESFFIDRIQMIRASQSFEWAELT